MGSKDLLRRKIPTQRMSLKAQATPKCRGKRTLKRIVPMQRKFHLLHLTSFNELIGTSEEFNP